MTGFFSSRVARKPFFFFSGHACKSVLRPPHAKYVQGLGTKSACCGVPNHTGIPFAARSVVKSAGISTFETSQSQKTSAVDSHAKPKSRASSKCMRKWATAYLRTPGYPSGLRAYSLCPNVDNGQDVIHEAEPQARTILHGQDCVAF